jgi:acyl transferase domain-containing protein/acyl carrier protein
MSNQREHRGSASPAIAVVGVSALFPGSSDVRGFWRSIVEGQNQIKEVPPQHWLIEDYYDPNPAAPDKTYGKTGAFLGQVPFDALGYGVPPNVVQQTDTSQLLGLIVAQQVLEDAAGGDFQHLDKSRISVILGATGATELVVHLGSRLQRPIWLNALRANGVPEDEAQAICDRIADSYVPWTEASFPGLLGNVVAGRIANKFDLGGTNCVVDAACASSLSALAMGLGELYLRQSDMVIVGGVDTLNDILMYMCFSKTPALSATGDCRPFSDQADGTILGEGLGMLALRRLEDAERDGDPIYAVIRGIGSSSDGAGTAVYAPKSSGQAHALRRAYAAAGYSPRTVELLEAHGTATKAGDAAEFAGAAGVFAEADPDSRQWCAIGSVKSQIGHTKGAAGAASLIKAVLALHHKVLPPTIKVARPNPNLGVDNSPFYINTQARPWIRDSSHPRRAGVSSFGFGGSNFHVTLEEYTGDSRKDEFRPAPTELFLVGASDVAEITAAARTLTDGFDGVGGFQFLARASQLSFRSADRLRLAVVASDLADLRSKLEAAAAAIERTPTNAQQSPTGWYFSGDAANANANAVGRLAFLFPGQGSQYVGMGGDLAMAFDDSRAVWDEAANLEFEQGNRLPEIVFPRPVFSDDDRASQETRLRATEWAQPAIGVASLSMLALLNRLGVSPDVVGGHSFGEVTALHTAGVLDRKAFFAVARKRGELMAEAAAMFPGAMTAVSHAADAVVALLASWNTGVVIANHNSPEQVVISGIESAIQATEEKLRAAGIRFQRLPVSTAFHSAVVRPAAAPFRTFLEHVAVHRPQLPVYANSTAAAYSTVPDAIRETLAGQIAEPVRFAEQIEAMYAAGVRTFIEVGPGGVLANLVKSCLKDRPHRAITLDRKGQHGLTSLWHGLGQLAVAGVGLALEQLWAGVAVGADPLTRKQPKLAVNISGVNYNKPYPPANGAAGLAAPNPPRNGNHAVTNRQPAVADKGAAEKVVAGNGRGASNGPVTPVTPPAAGAVQPVAPALPPATQPALVQQPAAPAAVRPAPTPVATPPPAAVQPAPAPIVAPAPPVASANAGESLAWVQAFQHMQQQTANAHMAFLQVAEQSLRSLEAMLSGARSEGRGFDVSSAERAISAPALSVSTAPVAYAAVIPAPTPSPTPMAAPVMAPAPEKQLPMVNGQLPIVNEDKTAPAAPVTIHNSQFTIHTSPAPDLHAIMMAVVTEKTGYPTEMLERSMALDTDLGIDSIKRVEILAAVRERVPSLPEFDTNIMAGLRTLGEIVDYMDSQLGRTTAAAQNGIGRLGDYEIGAVAPRPSPLAPDLHAIMMAVVTEKTGYPTEMLERGMALDTDLGIDSIKRVEILAAVRERVPSLPKFDTNIMAGLRTLGEIVDYMDGQLGKQQLSMVNGQLPIVNERSASPSLTINNQQLTIDNSPDLHAIMMAVVTEKTGYPTEMLERGMALDTDLGIDSIKRVEILAAVRERVPSLPEFDTNIMAGLRTLGEIVDYMDGQLGEKQLLMVNGQLSIVNESAVSPSLTINNQQLTIDNSPDLHAIMMAVVTEKTGYPTEMLERGMALDTDLGIDSIKRVEILAAVRERVPSLPEFDTNIMGSLRTLGEIVDYMDGQLGKKQLSMVNGQLPIANESAGSPSLTINNQQLTIDNSSPDPIRRYILEMVPQPAPGLAPPFLVDGTPVYITDDGRGIAPQLAARLTEAGAQAVVTSDVPADARAVICLDGLRPVRDAEAALAVNAAVFRIATTVAAGYEAAGGLFITVQDTGGDHGLFSASGDRAWLGGLSGLAKTAAQEWPKAVVRSIDLAASDAAPEAVAERLAAELLQGGADREIGLTADGGRYAFRLHRENSQRRRTGRDAGCGHRRLRRRARRDRGDGRGTGPERPPAHCPAWPHCVGRRAGRTAHHRRRRRAEEGAVGRGAGERQAPDPARTGRSGRSHPRRARNPCDAGSAARRRFRSHLSLLRRHRSGGDRGGAGRNPRPPGADHRHRPRRGRAGRQAPGREDERRFPARLWRQDRWLALAARRHRRRSAQRDLPLLLGRRTHGQRRPGRLCDGQRSP